MSDSHQIPITDEMIALAWNAMRPSHRLRGIEAHEAAEMKAAISAALGAVPAVAVPMAEAWELSAADTERRAEGAGQDYNQGVAEGLRICAKDLRAALDATPAAVPTYIEVRECSDCGHIGINDADGSKAACSKCDWQVDSPVEDKCPNCNTVGTMTAACSKCGARASLLAETTLHAEPIAAAAPVVLPEPEAAIKEVMGLVEALAFSSVDYGHKRAFIDPECEAARKEAGQAHRAVESKLRALLATGGQAQAVERGEVLVTVSGFTGSGKSAIAGEIEILCRALGLQVEWPDGDSEKNMTHADWTAALEQYKPRVHIVEQNIPFAAMKGMSK